MKEATTLKCKTNKICVRGDKLFGGGECEEFANLKPITYAEVNTLADVQEVIANDVVDCWRMTGEGKLPLFSEGYSKYGIGDVYPSSIICSRIAFDNEGVKEKKIDIEKRNLAEYMQTHLVPNTDVTYTKYMSG